MTPQSEGGTLQDLVDMRHKLTALIKENLYGKGSKPEGQAALIARNTLDKHIFLIIADEIAKKGDAAGIAPLKRAIILETYSELVAILDDYSSRFGRGATAIKQGMSVVLSDPDVLGRFEADQQAEIRAIATGSSLFTNRKFDRLRQSILREAGKYM